MVHAKTLIWSIISVAAIYYSGLKFSSMVAHILFRVASIRFR